MNIRMLILWSAYFLHNSKSPQDFCRDAGALYQTYPQLVERIISPLVDDQGWKSPAEIKRYVLVQEAINDLGEPTCDQVEPS